MAKIGYQLYSARREAAEDFAGTLKAIKEMGYEGVELAGFYGKTAQEIKTLLDEAGLVAPSAHVPLAEIVKDPFKVLSDYKTIGVQYITIPHTDNDYRPGGCKFGELLKTVWHFGSLCREAGFRLLYHNHDFEFVNVSGIPGLDFLYSAVDEALLQTEIDTCWVAYAGFDPLKYLKAYAGRCPVVHLKDYVGKKGGSTPYALIGVDEDKKKGDIAFEFLPLGMGVQKMAEIIKASVEAGAEWLVVEQDESVGRTPLESARISIEYLRKHL